MRDTLLSCLETTGFPPYRTPDLLAAYTDTTSQWPLDKWREMHHHIHHAVRDDQYYYKLAPWRKGPIKTPTLTIDAEWDCRIKWARLAPLLPQLVDKTVLDIGSNNGYFTRLFRQAGARHVIGIEPTFIYTMQFLAQQLENPDHAITTLPLRLGHINRLPAVNIIACMGVLYHVKSIAYHLGQLYRQLTIPGELWLETFTIPNQYPDFIYPTGRVAGIAGIRVLPTLAALLTLMRQSGFKNTHVLSVGVTQSSEQRPTAWCFNQSYQSDLGDTITREGYPTPRRTLICASKLR